MLDELELSFEDSNEHWRHRRGRRAGGGKPTKRRGRSMFALLLVLILFGVLGLGGWYGVNKVRDYFSIKDYNGSGSGSVTVQVVSGNTATDIANTLYTAGVIRSAKAFLAAASNNPQSKTVEAGYYKLHKQMKASLALDMLLARDKDGTLTNSVSTKVTITEGEISIDIYQKLSKATNIPATQFADLAKDPVSLGVATWWFNRGDGKTAVKSLEGFLYPDTYNFPPGADAKTILTTIVSRFNDEMTKLDFPNKVQANLNISPAEALVAASIEQVEAQKATDMPNVASVLYNRAYKDFACNCLGLDSEVNYWLRISGQEAQDSGNLKQSQLHDKNDPYNTHDNKGLPVGAISNPGEAALSAAMAPPKTSYYYFLAIDKAGNTAFAANANDFEKLKTQACKNGINIC
jgi:UPF0755 protein